MTIYRFTARCANDEPSRVIFVVIHNVHYPAARPMFSRGIGTLDQDQLAYGDLSRFRRFSFPQRFDVIRLEEVPKGVQ